MTWEKRKKQLESGLERLGRTKETAKKADNPFGVDDNYINTFISDTKNYYKDEAARYNSSGYGDTASNRKTFESARDSLAPRVQKLKAYAVRQRGSLTDEQRKRIDDAISYYTNATSEISGAYDAKIGDLSKFASEDEYKAATKKAEDLQTRKDKYNLSENPTVDEVEEVLRGLKVQRAKEGLLEGEDKTLDSDIEFFENYALRYGYGSSSDYDKVINRLKNEKSIYDERLAASANEMLSDGIISQMDKRDELQKQIDTMTAEKNSIKNTEKFWNSYDTQRSSEDYVSKSKPISTAKNLSDYELNGMGYEKAEDGSWYKIGLGGVSYYEPYEDMLHAYINATPEEQDRMFNEESITSNVGRGVSHADRVATSRYSTYGEMADEEKQLYNYIYNTEGKDAAKAMLDQLKPTLDKRFQQSETIRLAELAYKDPVFASGASIVTNVQSAMMAPAQLTASLVGKNDIWLDNSAMTTSALRSGAGKRVGDLPLLDTELPVVGNAGEFLYGGLMSMADMGVAMGLGAGLGGSSNAAAKITQTIMSSSAAANEIYSAHERGITGPEAAVRGVIAGAAEWITEKYSVENLFSDKSHGIVLEALKQMGIEASEETASSLINKAADLIVSELAGHENEYEARVRELIEGGATRKEAEKAALTEFWRELGTDALSGALMGAVMGAGKGVAVKGSTKAESKTVKAARQIAAAENVAPGTVEVSLNESGKMELKVDSADSEGGTVDISALPEGSTKTILHMAEEAGMTPAAAQALVESYDGETPINEFIAEAEYIFSMGKTGTPISSVARVNVSEEMKNVLYSDGESLTKAEITERSNALKAITDKATKLMTAGTYDDSAIKGMKLNRTQERSVRFAEALSEMGFNIKLVTRVSGNKKALGAYNKETGVIELNVNARLTDSHGNLKEQILPTLSHEITHQMRDTAPELYEEYKSIVLQAFAKSGDVEALIQNESTRLRDTGRYDDMSDAAVYDLAVDEIIARSAEDMLTNDKVIEQIFRENRTVGEKILQFITDFVNRLKETIKGIDTKSTREEARILREMVGEFEAARDAWAKAFQRTREVVSAVNEVGDYGIIYGENGEAVPQGRESGRGVMYSEAPADAVYMDAVNRGDMETAQKMVDEAAKEAGFTPEHLFHGTSSFGFTTIDTNSASDDSISFFVTNNPEVAQGYMPWFEDEESDAYHEDVRRIGKNETIGLSITNSTERILREAQKVFPEYGNARVATDDEVLNHFKRYDIPEAVDSATKLSNIEIEIVSPRVAQQVKEMCEAILGANEQNTYSAWKSVAQRYKEFESIDIPYDATDMRPTILHSRILGSIQSISKMAKATAIWKNDSITSTANIVSRYNDLLGGKTIGMYDLYANHENQLVIRGNGSVWDDIPLKGIAEQYNTWAKAYLNQVEDKSSASTRDIAAFAKANGYRSVAFFDIYDAGMYGDRTEISDVYAFFYPNEDIKSADPVTYDDNGNVIPLSERFKKSNPDIRFSDAPNDKSMREVLTDALVETVQTEDDRKALERYRKRVSQIDGYEARLREVNRELKELSFGKGKRDNARIAELKSEKAALEQDLRRADRKLLQLESTAAIKRLFDAETRRIRKEKAAAYREELREVKRMSREELQEAVKRGKEKLAKEKEKRKDAVMTERWKAAERELADRTRRKRYEVARRVENTIKFITHQTDDKNVKQGLKGVAADFMHAILSNNAVYTASEMHRMSNAYAKIAEAAEGVEAIYKGSYDFDIQAELEELDANLKGRAWRDLTIEELDVVDRVTRNVTHMIRSENRIFRQGKGESRVALGEACERAIAELSSKRREKLTPKSKVGQKVQSFGEAVDKMITTGNLMPVYYFDMLGGEFKKLYGDLVAAQNKAARIYEESRVALDAIKEKHDHKKIIEGETVFTTDEGVSFEMTVREAMYFYAALKRELMKDETNHYLGGGIASKKIVAKASGDSVKSYRSGTVRLSGEDAGRIIDSLSAEQKAFVDDLVAYLSTDLAKYGNETSMELYGIEKFRDEYYVPFVVSGDAILKDPIEAAEPGKKGKGGGEAKIKHMGSTHAIQHGASNAMEQADIMEVFSNHCVEMANYASFAVPIENIGGVLNFRGESGDLLRAEMRSKLGDNMTRYLDTFIRDLNGGIKATPTGLDKLISLGKKAPIAGSLSVAVQQSFSIIRAANVINPIYFADIKGGERLEGLRSSWDEMKRYAPGVTIVKDMGKFDIGSGISAAEYIHSDASFGKAVDKGLGFLAEWGDKIAWIRLWTACKAEAKHKGLRGEALLESAGKRFTDIVNRTQVYDSVLVRSENMRSRDPLMKMVTAYKAEPTVNLNMLAAAFRSKSPAKIARATATFLLGTVATSAAAALIYAGRDDDEEKTYFEKYGVEFSEKLIDELLLWNSVPILSDIASLSKGFSVDRQDMGLIEDVISAGLELATNEEAGHEEWLELAGGLLNLGGIPFRNIYRDFYSVPKNIINSPRGSTWKGFEYGIKDKISKGTTGKMLSRFGVEFEHRDYNGYIDALESGDTKEAARIYSSIVEYKLFKAERKAHAEGKEYNRGEALEKAESSIQAKITERLEGVYADYLTAIDKGDTAAAKRAVDTVTKVQTAFTKGKLKYEGREYTRKREEKNLESIESRFQSRVTKQYKDLYVNGDDAERERIQRILRRTGLYKNVRTTTKAWLKAAEEDEE